MNMYILNKNNKVVLIGLDEFKFMEDIKTIYIKETNKKPNGDINELAFELIDYGYNFEIVEK